jgi:hypothetical protein
MSAAKTHTYALICIHTNAHTPCTHAITHAITRHTCMRTHTGDSRAARASAQAQQAANATAAHTVVVPEEIDRRPLTGRFCLRCVLVSGGEGGAGGEEDVWAHDYWRTHIIHHQQTLNTLPAPHPHVNHTFHTQTLSPHQHKHVHSCRTDITHSRYMSYTHI